MIRVLVVEDDFRVAALHVTFAESVPGFTVVGTALTAAQARNMVATTAPDLVLLDIYLPDDSGLRLLAEIGVDTIVLTAASDPTTVRTASAHGALNYLVKPFTAEELTERLRAYQRYRDALAASDRSLDQKGIDQARGLLHQSEGSPLGKGQSTVTARLVAEALRRTAGAPRTAADVANELGIARATAQRYLAALEQAGSATMTLRYGTAGRPEHLYIWQP